VDRAGADDGHDPVFVGDVDAAAHALGEALYDAGAEPTRPVRTTSPLSARSTVRMPPFLIV